MSVNNLILGLTGNIACGKSLVADAFARQGAAVVDADLLAREVVAAGSQVLRALREVFGADILLADGELNRERLGQIIFSDPAARQQLNRVIHPAIAELAEERLQRLKTQSDVPLIIYAAPLLFEAAAEGRVDKVLVVQIDPKVQLRRLMARDQLDETAARLRIAAQLPQQEKLARADYVIDNSGTVEQALQQVDQLWERLAAE